MNTTPKITVILPIYNSKEYLNDAINSIIHQTYTDWEMLAINEYGSNDGSADIINKFSAIDDRIQLIQNDAKLGLAASLNKGIVLAKGEYIARMDADDLSMPLRFEKQVQLMDNDKTIGICGTYQRHFGPNINWIHKPPISFEECKANILFDCDLCHSTVMLRKDIIMSNNLLYNEEYLAEDFELWSRAVAVTKITNIPEVLGAYRWDNSNITIAKKTELAKEHARIIAKSLKINLDIEIQEGQYLLLEGWHNPFKDEKNKSIRKQMYLDFKELLIKIYYQNKIVQFYNDQALLNIIASKWRHVKYYEPRNAKREVNSLDEIFSNRYIPNVKLILGMFWASGPSMKARGKKLISFLCGKFK